MENNTFVKMNVTLRETTLNLFEDIDTTKKELTLVVTGKPDWDDKTKTDWTHANAFEIETLDRENPDPIVTFINYEDDNNLLNTFGWKSYDEAIATIDNVEIIGYIGDDFF